MLGSSFDRPVVLFDDVVQIFSLTDLDRCFTLNDEAVRTDRLEPVAG
jgi:hypothetical protein